MGRHTKKRKEREKKRERERDKKRAQNRSKRLHHLRVDANRSSSFHLPPSFRLPTELAHPLRRSERLDLAHAADRAVPLRAVQRAAQAVRGGDRHLVPFSRFRGHRPCPAGFESISRKKVEEVKSIKHMVLHMPERHEILCNFLQGNVGNWQKRTVDVSSEHFSHVTSFAASLLWTKNCPNTKQNLAISLTIFIV